MLKLMMSLIILLNHELIFHLSIIVILLDESMLPAVKWSSLVLVATHLHLLLLLLRVVNLIARNSTRKSNINLTYILLWLHLWIWFDKLLLLLINSHLMLNMLLLQLLLLLVLLLLLLLLWCGTRSLELLLKVLLRKCVGWWLVELMLLSIKIVTLIDLIVIVQIVVGVTCVIVLLWSDISLRSVLI